MANIPGISGYVQPGVFARDRVVSSSVSIPGGLRVLTIMGEGLRETVLVESAQGSGLDGNASISPTGSADGKYFLVPNSPLVSGRTEVYLNDSLLYGKQESVSSSSFSYKFDYRLDHSKGILELQGASIKDQDGKGYSSGSKNIGTGILVEESCASTSTLSVLDSSAPSERWTLKCISVIRDSSGNPTSGNSTFTLTGSSSGQILDSSGSPLIFSDSYYSASDGAVSGNSNIANDGYPVAKSSNFADGTAILQDSTSSATKTNYFKISGHNLVSDGQSLVGDYLHVDGYDPQRITNIVYNSTDSATYITVKSAVYNVSTSALLSWSIKATDLFIANHIEADMDLDGISDGYYEKGPFSSDDVGRVLAICSGSAAGNYTIKSVTSSRRIRVHKYGDSSAAFPSASSDASEGLSQINSSYKILETNGVILFGIKTGTTPFDVGDKFYIDVSSRVLKKGDNLTVKYISELDVNDPQFFSSSKELISKHGLPLLSNTLSLGAAMAFENGAPGVLAVQCKPAVPRRTTVTLLEEKDSTGQGGFRGCGGSAAECEVDDLLFPIKRPIFGLRDGKPDGDTQVNIFIVRNGIETQVFPNKVGFYNSQLESETQQTNFISSSDYSFSYTIVNTDLEIIGSGDDGNLFNDSTTAYFSTAEVDFDGADVDNETIIVITSMVVGSTVLTEKEEIAQALFGSSSGAAGVELTIDSIINDNLITVNPPTSYSFESDLDIENIQFFVKNKSNTTDVSAALLLNSDIVESGTLKEGDGIKISYIDQNDAEFFDSNWFNAFDKLESQNTQIIVPLPIQAKSSIFRAAVNHCELMSSIANRRERVALIGAISGVDDQALIGNKLVAVEDIGVLEGIQGDDPEEVLAEDIEDLVNFKLNDNFTSNRCSYFFPDKIVRNINGTNSFLDGFYIAAAAGGRLSGTSNVALPLTNKTLSGFTILRDKVYKESVLNSLGSVGATVLQPVTGGGRILASRTTSNSGYVEDEELSVVFIRDNVKQTLRNSLTGFIGQVQDENTNTAIGVRVSGVMNGLISRGFITSYQGLRIERDKVDPRQINVFVRFTPAFPINYIFVDIEVSV